MSNTNIVLASDGTSLKKSLAKSLRRQKIRALLLIAPLLFFVLLTFIAPIGDMLFRSVENNIVSDTLPRTVKVLSKWDSMSGQAPDEEVFEAFARDLKIAVKSKLHTKLGSRLNYEKTGISSLVRQTGRKVKKLDLDATPSFKDAFEKMNKKWMDPSVWQTIQKFSSKYTDGYFLAAADLTRTSEGIQKVDEDKKIYFKLFVRTLYMSLGITFMCILLGYPIAFLLATLPMRSSNVLMILVLLPFWTSLLVRTSAWKVLLQNQGVINDFLVWLGVIADGNRLELINNVTGTVIAMTHILLPFMILPLFSVMKTIPPTYMRAAKSMGANDFMAFRRVYFPQSIPGIGAGSILVFILAIGYYITPEIVGGTKGVFISNRIAYHISSSLNWGLGAALGAILLVVVLALYWLYDKFVGIDNVKLG
ncbi:ABC transporter permease [Amylibacter sp.]|nr:ABC transporter permease [Amylibacter sp.]MDC0008475.1 ABC transporter permease [Amylibacter sp.]